MPKFSANFTMMGDEVAFSTALSKRSPKVSPWSTMFPYDHVGLVQCYQKAVQVEIKR